MGNNFTTQSFPPHASLTGDNLPSQKGKVFIVTGGASGVGYQLVSILYRAGGKVYIAGRSEPNALKSIEEIKSSVHENSSIGQLEYLSLDLGDLTSIKASAEAFKRNETRLDVLWNNAGVSNPPVGSVTKQGYELQIGTNCLGPFLFTQLLLPELQAAAKGSPPGTVRVVWTSSFMVDAGAPKGGFQMEDITKPPKDAGKNYTASKTGNWFLASELAREVGSQGIISVTQNPGNIKTNILRHFSMLFRLIVSPILYEAKYGAYTELWAGLSPHLTMEMNGGYVIPWGRIHSSPRQDLLDALKATEEGGTGIAAEFREWCEKQVADYK